MLSTGFVPGEPQCVMDFWRSVYTEIDNEEHAKDVHLRLCLTRGLLETLVLRESIGLPRQPIASRPSEIASTAALCRSLAFLIPSSTNSH